MERGLSKKERLLKRADFLRVQREGAKSHSEHFIVLIAPGPGLNHHRLGITTSKNVGSAVRRNRVKRLVREFFRLNKRELFPNGPESGVDVVFIAKRNLPYLGLEEVTKELSACCRKSRSS